MTKTPIRIKKALSLLLALCLLGTLGTAAAANRDVFPTAGDTYMNMVSLAKVGEDLLITKANELYRLAPDGGEPQMIRQTEAVYLPGTAADAPPDRFDVLMADQGKLYAFDLFEGRLFNAVYENGDVTLGEPIKLELGNLIEEQGDYTYLQRPDEMLVLDGFLYFISRDYNSGSGAPALIRFDLATGARHDFETPHINHMAAYKDGKILVMLWDMENGFDQQLGKQTPATLAVFDPNADAVTELGVLTDSEGSEGFLGYDAESDTIYSSRRGRLYRRTAQDLTRDELCGYIPSNNLWGILSGAITPYMGGVAVLTSDNLYLRDADPNNLPDTTLTVYGEYGSPAHRQAQSKMPEVPIQLRDREYFGTAQELGQALVSGENTMDVYFVDYSFIDVPNLLEKQYAQDLSGSKVLTDYAAQLYPYIKAAGTQDGKLMMLPVEASLGETMMAYTELFEEIGEEIPETFLELVDLVGRWPDEFAEKYPDIVPLQTENYKNQLFYLALNKFRDLRTFQGQEFKYDDPLLRKLLTAVAELDTKDLDKKINWDDMGETEEFFSRRALMDMSGGLGVAQFDTLGMNKSKIVNLRVDEGEEAVMPMMLRVAAINPRSKNIEQAIRYLENYVASMPQENRVVLMPDANDPVPNPRYEQERKDMQGALTAYENALATAEDAAKSEMESAIKNLTDYMSEHETTGKFIITEQGIQAFRTYAGNAFLTAYDPVQSGSEDLYNLYDRYLQGQIDLDTMIREADGKLRLMRLENQ